MRKYIHFLYTKILKRWFFLFDPEFVHNRMVKMGVMLGKTRPTRMFVRSLFSYQHQMLETKIGGTIFKNPVGLSAGFDYDAQLTQILGEVGFGFESVGTVTYGAYEGNKRPMLARLPASRSLLVNKGFKSIGLPAVLEQITFPTNDFQVGISIGATNSPATSTARDQIRDIVKSFEFLLAHPKGRNFGYYELNISCPNVAGAGNLASVKDFTTIMRELTMLRLPRPLFVKFPIEISESDAAKLVEIMITHKVAAVTIGNLLKNRQSDAFVSSEIAKMQNLKGNFSGKPTWDLSNQLIASVYKRFGRDIKIIGVGGIFSAEDAYHKIGLGASMVQLITGMIFEGPQLIGQINQGLIAMLKRDGFASISEAVGHEAKTLNPKL
jgi:dihydroorotate dehydrogenase subfamily 2